jgi:hypothetical protein
LRTQRHTSIKIACDNVLETFSIRAATLCGTSQTHAEHAQRIYSLACTRDRSDPKKKGLAQPKTKTLEKAA